MKNSHARNHPAVSEQIGMETYRNVKQADYTKEAEVYDLKRFSHVAGRFYAELSNQIIFDLLEAKEGDRILTWLRGRVGFLWEWRKRAFRSLGPTSPGRWSNGPGKRQPRRTCECVVPSGRWAAASYKENTFDKIVSIRFFHILPFEMQKAILQEVRRVLKPGGTFIVEFNSPFAGLFLWAWRRDHLVIWPRQVRELFQGMTITKKVGVMLPGLGRIAKVNPQLGYTLGRRLDFFPFNHLCNQILIVARK